MPRQGRRREPLDGVFSVLRAVEAWPTQRLVDGGPLRCDSAPRRASRSRAGLGPNNPHGEESEDVYVVDRSDLGADTIVALRRDREVWW